MTSEFHTEIKARERFRFGDNWASFLRTLNEDRIAASQRGLLEMLGRTSLDGLRFLDIGSGSGLSSLAARRLGATVHSFDFDPQSVACTMELKRRYFGDDSDWRVDEGSALDPGYLASLGKFDVVYAWGVLHHTGAMYDALRNATEPLDPGGQLLIAIYSDQGLRSRVWWRVKRTYCSGPAGRAIVTAVFVPYFFLRASFRGLMDGGSPTKLFHEYRQRRGMSIYHDWIDWLGGFPYEVATPDELEGFFRALGFTLERIRTTEGMGCNELVFRRTSLQPIPGDRPV